jgi:hypothetical protein
MRTVWKVLIALALLAAAAVGGFLWFMGHAKRTLTPRVEAFLTAVTTGKYDAAYDLVSPGFQNGFTRPAFRATIEEVVAPLGAFQRVADVSGVAMSSSTGEGTTGSLDAELVFEKATVPGSFELVKVADVWRIQKFELKELTKVIPPPDPAALEPAGRALLTAFDGGDFEAIHGMFLGNLRDGLPAETLKTKFGPVREVCPSFGSPALTGTADQAEGAKELTFEGTCPDGVHVTSRQIWQWRAVGWKLQNIKITKAEAEEPPAQPTPE